MANISWKCGNNQRQRRRRQLVALFQDGFLCRCHCCITYKLRSILSSCLAWNAKCVSSSSSVVAQSTCLCLTWIGSNDCVCVWLCFVSRRPKHVLSSLLPLLVWWNELGVCSHLHNVYDPSQPRKARQIPRRAPQDQDQKGKR